MLSANDGHVGAQPSPITAIRRRASKVANLWIFESPKNDRRLTIVGDVPFMHLILLEGTPEVLRYQFVGDPFSVMGAEREASLPGYVRVENSDGPDTWLRIKRSGARPGRASSPDSAGEILCAAASAAGASYAEYTEDDLRGRETEFENWLILCACTNRAKGHPDYTERAAFVEALEASRTASVRSLLTASNVDPAIMLAVIASSLQQGVASTDLQGRLFGLDSEIQRRLA
ncbi:hypothetical protein IP91_00198 [Pseudoduganella lurida]|jgi:hypothetical protein|uniref:Uncharacterized protein n=2 Tax=Pseudoduganella lurida TaxID=1036180 RepID=A0A562RJ78_9BURK|nr:hypothetical protein IP91_00198 [Pseudoduganella lurida]